MVFSAAGEGLLEVCDEVDGEDVEGDEFLRVLKGSNVEHVSTSSHCREIRRLPPGECWLDFGHGRFHKT